MFKGLLLLTAAALTLARPSPPQAPPPTVKLDSATLTGTTNGTVTKFLGIPYAEPPVGNLRFRDPVPLGKYKGPINATQYGFLCPQQQATVPNSGVATVDQIISNAELANAPGVENEDCLTINVIKPEVKGNKKLPVVYWIHGGAFQTGDTSAYDQMGSNIVQRSLNLNTPVIFVSVNFRISAYGFLGGLEVYEAGIGNGGLKDQRLGLSWVQQYIGQFGGDKNQVILWGQSSGSISISLQLLAFDGNTQGLFHGAFMESGAPLPIGNITNAQAYYDTLTLETGCANSTDSLQCLRELPFETLKPAVDSFPNLFSYQSLVLVWHPRADGTFLSADPRVLVSENKTAKVPIVFGTCDDEGTAFALTTLNITTDDQFESYISTYWDPKATPTELAELYSYYNSSIPSGSPFNTGTNNALTPQFKRIAAFIGDAFLQAPRRYFFQFLSGKQPLWAFLNQRFKDTPYLGSYHGSDLLSGLVNDNVISFAVKLDPNTNSGIHWPQYSVQKPQLYTWPPTGNPVLTPDTFRSAQLQFLNNISLAHPLP